MSLGLDADNSRTALKTLSPSFAQIFGKAHKDEARGMGARGSPALAGIGPLEVFWDDRRLRFPRARGDRPSTSAETLLGFWVPPRSRG